jgi:hypothetical protein
MVTTLDPDGDCASLPDAALHLAKLERITGAVLLGSSLTVAQRWEARTPKPPALSTELRAHVSRSARAENRCDSYHCDCRQQ